MAEVRYDGTMLGAAEITYALSGAGYRVGALTPNSPRAATRFWVRARALFPSDTVEQGRPRDYRALVLDTQGRTHLVHVRHAGVMRLDHAARVLVEGPPIIDQRVPGLSIWQNTVSGQTHDVFTWDGTELGLVDLIAFFQLDGSLLNRLAPTPDRTGFSFLTGTATLLAREQVYQFDMTPGSRFVAGNGAPVQTVTQNHLIEQYRLVR